MHMRINEHSDQSLSTDKIMKNNVNFTNHIILNEKDLMPINKV